MGKVDGELKVMAGLLYKMILSGTNDAEKNCVKDYISKLHAADQSFKDNNIALLKRKYIRYSVVSENDIPDSVKKKAQKECNMIIKEIMDNG